MHVFTFFSVENFQDNDALGVPTITWIRWRFPGLTVACQNAPGSSLTEGMTNSSLLSDSLSTIWAPGCSHAYSPLDVSTISYSSHSSLCSTSGEDRSLSSSEFLLSVTFLAVLGEFREFSFTPVWSVSLSPISFSPVLFMLGLTGVEEDWGGSGWLLREVLGPKGWPSLIQNREL